MKKPIGIYNYGWNCYINSILQSLASSKFIIDFIENHLKEDQMIINTILKYDLRFGNDLKVLVTKCEGLMNDYKSKNKEIGDVEFLCIKYLKNHYKFFYAYICFRNIIIKINNSEEVLDPGEFIEVSKLSTNHNFNHLFDGIQSDPAEFLAYTFDMIHYCKSKEVKLNYRVLEETCRENKIINLYRNDYKQRYEKEFSMYVKKFMFYTMKTINCVNCDYVSYNFSPGHILHLPIPDNKSISVFDCLNEFTKKEKLDPDYKCDKCKKNNTAFIENSILSKNDTLILQFVRFSQHMNGSCHKNSSQIDFPLNLNISDYILTNDNDNYKLYAVVLHYGHMNGGHFVSCIKKKINNNDQWFLCDDENIKEINESNVLNHPNTYMLFYQIE